MAAIDISNTLRSTSIIRVEGTGTFYANLSDLSTNTALEVVSAASIKKMNWSTNGNISITRNGATVATLHNAGEIRCDEWGHAISSNSTANLVITVVTGGTLFLEVNKTATYTTALTGM